MCVCVFQNAHAAHCRFCSVYYGIVYFIYLACLVGGKFVLTSHQILVLPSSNWARLLRHNTECTVSAELEGAILWPRVRLLSGLRNHDQVRRASPSTCRLLVPELGLGGILTLSTTPLPRSSPLTRMMDMAWLCCNIFLVRTINLVLMMRPQMLPLILVQIRHALRDRKKMRESARERE